MLPGDDPEYAWHFPASVTLLLRFLSFETSHFMSVCGNRAHSSIHILVRTLSENFPAARRHLSCPSETSLPPLHYKRVLATSGVVQAKSMGLEIRITSPRSMIYWLCDLGGITF